MKFKLFDGLFAKDATVSDVHVDGAEAQKPKARNFTAVIGTNVIATKHDDAITWSVPVNVAKMDDDKCLVFGWASIVEKDGRPVIDLQGDQIDIADLEDAVYAYTLDKRDAGEMHERVTGVGKLVESMVMTVEKQRAMGLPEGSAPLGWWVGYKIAPDVFAKVKSGEYPMFSIGGGAIRVAI